MWLISFCTWLTSGHFGRPTIPTNCLPPVRRPVFHAKSRPEAASSSPFEVEGDHAKANIPFDCRQTGTTPIDGEAPRLRQPERFPQNGD